MQFSNYFHHTRQRPDRKEIKMEWIEQVYFNPEHEEIQSDGRIRRWALILEVNKYLRVIMLEDKTTIHNAFFDRTFKY